VLFDGFLNVFDFCSEDGRDIELNH
jgi:hypothetical protein